MKKKNRIKPTSIRLNSELQNDLEEKCSELGCSKNDLIVSSLEYYLYEVEDAKEESKSHTETEDKPIVKGTVTKISYDDGKTWVDVRELENAKVVEI